MKWFNLVLKCVNLFEGRSFYDLPELVSDFSLENVLILIEIYPLLAYSIPIHYGLPFVDKIWSTVRKADVAQPTTTRRISTSNNLAEESAVCEKVLKVYKSTSSLFSKTRQLRNIPGLSRSEENGPKREKDN